MRKLAPLAGLVLLVATGCTEAYRGRRPDLTLTDPGAQEAEIQRFTIVSRWGGWEMGGEEYEPGSLMPIMRDVSETAREDLDDAKTFNRIGDVVSLAGAGAFFVGVFAVEERDTSTALQLGGLGLSLVGGGLFNILAGSSYTDAIDHYNEDLRAAFPQTGAYRPRAKGDER